MLTLRIATPIDSLSLQEIFSEAIANAQWLPLSARLKTDFRSVSEGEKVVVCCNFEEKILGFVSVYEPDSFIHHLYVASPNQREGAGKALLNSLRTWLPMPWHLKCATGNEKAWAFYVRQGWIEESYEEGPDGPYVLLRKCEV